MHYLGRIAAVHRAQTRSRWRVATLLFLAIVNIIGNPRERLASRS